MKINVILADDHPILLEGVAHILSNVPAINVVGKAENSTAVVQLLEHTKCDILVTDYAMPGGEFGDGINFISYVRRRFLDVKIIVFTMLGNVAIVRELTKLGVASVVSKSGSIDNVLTAIYQVNAGGRYFPDSSPIEMREVRGNKQKLLSRRESEVVRLYISGMTVSEIAEQLKRSKQTVSTQKVNAMRKLGLTNDAELFRLAFDSAGGEQGSPLG
jgi:two-component system, NarL family, captular synthesis response regulator RcsB